MRRPVLLALFAVFALLARSVAGATPGSGAAVYASLGPRGSPAAAPGGTMQVMGIVLNWGPQFASDVSVTVTLPEHTTVVAFDSIGAMCSSPNSSTVSCTMPSMAVVPDLGCVIGLTVTFAVDSAATPDTPLPVTLYATAANASTTDAERTGTFIGHVSGPTDPTVTVSAPPTAYDDLSYTVSIDLTNTSSATSQVVLPPWCDLSIFLNSSASQVIAGDLVTFTLEVVNFSPTPAENAVATLSLPPEIELVSSSVPCPAGICSLGSIPGRTTMTYTVVGQVVGGYPEYVGVTASLSASNDLIVDINDRKSLKIWIIGSQADLGITITARPVVHPGPAQWTFNVKNYGDDNAVAPFITFDTPAGTTFSTFIGSAAASCAPPENGVTGRITCKGPLILFRDQTWAATVELNVPESAPSPVQMSATVFESAYDTRGANNVATASSLLVTAANLAIKVIASDTSETWEYHVTNSGPDAAKGVMFSLKVPDAVTVTSVRSNTGRCDFSGCLLGDLLPHAMDTVWVTLHALRNGSFQVGASAQAANASQQTTYRMLCARGAEGGVDLSLAASVTPAILYVGDTATFTYSVTNRSLMTAEDVNLEIHLPPQFAFVSGSPGCDATHCSLGSLVMGDTATATITAVATTAGYTCTDSRTSCAKAEVNEADNAASQLALILPPPESRHRAVPH